ncbi:MAG: LysM peptidoglycan-binding domain-containing protein, partial [Myxococcota bacterium]|nr:LysM peptidoglycan-binding domain-containing protein [Myxococcota bacterium]
HQSTFGLPTTPAAFTTAAPAAESSGGGPVEGADLSWLEGLALPDLPVRLEERVVWYLERFREPGRWRNSLASWVRRSGRYAGMIREVLRRHDLPEDLLWVAAIESGFDPTVRSSAGAVGVWQFMEAGGRIYGLEQTRWVDQRRNPERSTEAAALYLADLHARFSSWDLALAGFNMGYAGLERAVLKYGTNDYWTLTRLENALPYGTRLYVPKFLAVAIAARNPDLFGLAGLELDPPRSHDVVEVRGVHRIAAMARAAGITVEEFRALNPEMRRDRTPPGEEAWPARIPRGVARQFAAALPGVEAEHRVRRYTVRFGETIDDVAARFSTTARRIREINGLERGETVRGGDEIEAPDVEPRDLERPAEPPVVVVPADRFEYPDRDRLFYRVIAGDTLEAVTEHFSVTVTDLASWNVIDPEAALVPGMRVQVFPPPGFDVSSALVLRDGEVTLLAAASDELYEHVARQDGFERVVHVAEQGDTVESIARRFGTTERALARINGFGADHVPAPGDRVVVYAAVGSQQPDRRLGE